jgi:hypothetical protein
VSRDQAFKGQDLCQDDVSKYCCDDVGISKKCGKKMQQTKQTGRTLIPIRHTHKSNANS